MPKLKTIPCYVLVKQMPGRKEPFIASTSTYGFYGDYDTSEKAYHYLTQLECSGDEIRHGHVTVIMGPINDFKKPKHKPNSLNDLTK